MHIYILIELLDCDTFIARLLQPAAPVVIVITSNIRQFAGKTAKRTYQLVTQGAPANGLKVTKRYEFNNKCFSKYYIIIIMGIWNVQSVHEPYIHVFKIDSEPRVVLK